MINDILLCDRTTGKNIIWATNDYSHKANTEILPEHIDSIKPRFTKNKANQRNRTREKAEVFTPLHIVKAQNDLIDNAWASQNKTWQEYITSKRLEITCGEAPYIVSRYDVVTGELIPINERVGLLDRKFRAINVDDKNEWIHWAIKSLQSVYGFELQGDNLFLARKNVYDSFIDYYQAKIQSHGIFGRWTD